MSFAYTVERDPAFRSPGTVLSAPAYPWGTSGSKAPLVVSLSSAGANQKVVAPSEFSAFAVRLCKVWWAAAISGLAKGSTLHYFALSRYAQLQARMMPWGRWRKLFTPDFTQMIHALLIEDNRIEARQTQHWLAARKDIGLEVEWVDRLSTGLERISRGGIDVVLLDLNLPDSRGLETFGRLHQAAPEVPVIVLTGEDDESIGILAVQQGAADYLVKQQVDGGTLPKTVQFTVVRHRAQLQQFTQGPRSASGRVLSFLGAKGGVGTTTVAVNVATALGETGKSVILAELQPTLGCLALSLQGGPVGSLANLLKLPADQIHDQELEGALSPGPASIRILFGSQAETGQELDAEQTEAIINGLVRHADFVILDLSWCPSAATAAAVGLSHYVALVTEREPLSVRCGQAAVSRLKSWGVSDSLIGAIVVGSNNLSLAMDLPTIRSLLGCGVLRMVPPAPAACYKAYVDRVPLVLSHPQNDAAEAFHEIAKMFADERGVRIEAA